MDRHKSSGTPSSSLSEERSSNKRSQARDKAAAEEERPQQMLVYNARGIDSDDELPVVKKRPRVGPEENIPSLKKRISHMPDDIAREIFEFLDIKSRLRFRVNRHLYQFESGQTYALEKLNIVNHLNNGESNDQFTMLLTRGIHTHLLGIEKLARNYSFGTICFRIRGTKYGNLLSAVSQIRSDSLIIDIQSETVRVAQLTEETVEGLTMGRVNVEFRDFIPVLSSALLNRLYERIGSTDDSLKEVNFHYVPAPTVKDFLGSLGVFIIRGRFTSSIPGFTVHTREWEHLILIGRLLITVGSFILRPLTISIQRDDIHPRGQFSISVM